MNPIYELYFALEKLYQQCSKLPVESMNILEQQLQDAQAALKEYNDELTAREKEKLQAWWDEFLKGSEK